MTYYVLGIALLALVYAVLMATPLALLLSPVIGVVAFFFWRLVDPEEYGRKGHVRAVLTAGAGASLGFVSGWLLDFTDRPLFDGAGILLAGAVASAVYSWRAQARAVTCVLCDNSASDPQGFDCPRCGDRVCTRTTCWNSRYSRCVRCFTREIVIFPIQEKWWVTRLGRRVMTGECLSCGKEAQEPDTDLRDCGQCHWPMCRRCWDYYNGVCQRCQWVIPDLPPRLAPFVRKAKRPRDQAGPVHAPRDRDEPDRPPSRGPDRDRHRQRREPQTPPGPDENDPTDAPIRPRRR